MSTHYQIMTAFGWDGLVEVIDDEPTRVLLERHSSDNSWETVNNNHGWEVVKGNQLINSCSVYYRKQEGKGTDFLERFDTFEEFIAKHFLELL